MPASSCVYCEKWNGTDKQTCSPEQFKTRSLRKVLSYNKMRPSGFGTYLTGKFFALAHEMG
jgi:hypothetical protein